MSWFGVVQTVDSAWHDKVIIVVIIVIIIVIIIITITIAIHHDQHDHVRHRVLLRVVLFVYVMSYLSMSCYLVCCGRGLSQYHHSETLNVFNHKHKIHLINRWRSCFVCLSVLVICSTCIGSDSDDWWWINFEVVVEGLFCSSSCTYSRFSACWEWRCPVNSTWIHDAVGM